MRSGKRQTRKSTDHKIPLVHNTGKGKRSAAVANSTAAAWGGRLGGLEQELRGLRTLLGAWGSFILLLW